MTRIRQLRLAWLTALVMGATLLAVRDSSTRADDLAWPAPNWQTATPESQGVSPEKLRNVEQWLKDKGSKTGLMVRHGRIVGEWYFDDAKPESRYLVYSTSKSFSSTAVGLAVAEGKLTLDTKVGELLPDVSPVEKREITVRHLISMTSGVFNDGAFPQREDQLNYALREAPMIAPPGSKWDYNNTGLAILSPLMQKATGKDLDQYLNAKLFEPIGIGADDWRWEHRNEQPISYSGLHITARGLARFGLLALRRGQWQDRQIFPSSWIDEATAPSQTLNKGYGYLWWNNTQTAWPGVPADAYAALGRFDNSMLVVPSLDLIVLRQIGVDTESKRDLRIAELWKLACDCVTDAPAPSK